MCQFSVLQQQPHADISETSKPQFWAHVITQWSPHLKMNAHFQGKCKTTFRQREERRCEWSWNQRQDGWTNVKYWCYNKQKKKVSSSSVEGNWVFKKWAKGSYKSIIIFIHVTKECQRTRFSLCGSHSLYQTLVSAICALVCVHPVYCVSWLKKNLRQHVCYSVKGYTSIKATVFQWICSKKPRTDRNPVTLFTV